MLVTLRGSLPVAAKQAKFKTFDLYEYRWIDHHSNSGWQSNGTTTPYEVYSIGYLIGEDKQHLIFTQGICPSSGTYQGSMGIVKSAVTYKKKLPYSLKFEL